MEQMENSAREARRKRTGRMGPPGCESTYHFEEERGGFNLPPGGEAMRGKIEQNNVGNNRVESVYSSQVIS